MKRESSVYDGRTVTCHDDDDVIDDVRGDVTGEVWWWCRTSEVELRKVMKTVSESFAERHCMTDDTSPVSSGQAVITRSSSAVSDDSSSDLMEHFMSELDLVFSDILAEEVSRRLLLTHIHPPADKTT